MNKNKKGLGAILLTALLFASCNSVEAYKLLDDEHKTFCVNGISAIDGYEAIANSLKEMGFEMDKEGVQEFDLTYGGGSFTYGVNYYADSLTEKQASKLTAGLFDNLPSGILLGELTKNGCRVYLSWYRTGEVKKSIVSFGDYMNMFDDDFIEVNKRLSNMFPHSKISNQSYGYKTYYNDNGVEMYFPNVYWIELEKK